MENKNDRNGSEKQITKWFQIHMRQAIRMQLTWANSKRKNIDFNEFRHTCANAPVTQ